MINLRIRAHHRAAGFAARFVFAVLVAALAACGSSGDSSPSTPTTPTIDYPNSIALGAPVPQALVYTAGSATTPAMVIAPAASALLAAGTTPLVADHTDPALPGLRVACVSGTGDSTNVVTGINLGVISQSAAVLFDADWNPVESSSAWAAAVASGGAWLGWENCGVKPEGLPTPSSRLLPTSDGGYTEDVYDGNPSTTFNVVRRQVAPAEVAAMLSTDGDLTTEDPLRPLRLTWRAYADGAGHMVFVEVGVPAAGAPASTRGFVALYVSAS